MDSLTVDILGYNIYADDLNKIKTHKKLVINTLNGHSYSVAKKDKLFHEALLSSDVLLPDGVSVTLGIQIGKGMIIPKIAGFDLFMYLMCVLDRQKGSCFFLGSQPQTLDLIKEKICKEYPDIRVGLYSPPYVSEFSEEQTSQMCQIVNEFNPDVLFVGMTAPKQEKWVYQNKKMLNANLICSIGAVFDFYAGTKKRPAKWMIKWNLEWLGRFLNEPGRLFYRYFVSTPVIFVDLFLQKIKQINSVKPVVSNKSKLHKSREIGQVEDLDINFHYKLLDKRFNKVVSEEKHTH